VVAASVETMAAVALAEKVAMMGVDSNQQKDDERANDVLVDLCHTRNRLDKIAMEATTSSIWRRK